MKPYLLCSFVPVLTAVLTLGFGDFVRAVDGAQRVFEMRTYYANPGKLDDLHARFRDHTMAIFAKHGMENIGYWVPLDNTENKLVYLLAYPSREARDQAWKAFGADPEWRSAYRESTRNGRLVGKVDSVFLKETDYSPAVVPAKRNPNRVFELRTYHAAPGKLNALHDRFRDHTLKLFTKHGMDHFGYWSPLDKKNGADDTLIYLIAHENRASRDKSFADFRADPDWLRVKGESEKDGSLTSKVDSTLMVPTDYSPTQ